MTARFHPLLRLIFAAVGAVVALLAISVVIGVALTVAAQMAHRPLTTSSDFVTRNQLLLQVLTYPPILLWLWFCRRTFDLQSFRSLGFRASGALRQGFSGALCGALALSFLFAVLWLCGWVRFNGFSSEWKTAGTAAIPLLAAYLLAFCAVGFTEETVFRGYAFHNLTAWLGVRTAIWTQAVLFGLIHLTNVFGNAQPNATVFDTLWDARWSVCNIALIGAFFALSYLKTGSLWFPIGFHIAWNFLLGCVFSLPVSGIKTFRVLDVVANNSSASGGSFGLEGSVFLIGILAAMLWFLSREKDDTQALQDLSLLRPDALIASQNADETSIDDEENEDDATHIPRFRTSMRPVSSRPTLQIERAAFETSSTRSGFAPPNQAQIPNAQIANAQIANASIAANAPFSANIDAPISANPIAQTSAFSQTETPNLETSVQVFAPTKVETTSENAEVAPALLPIETPAKTEAVAPKVEGESAPIVEKPTREKPLVEVAQPTATPVSIPPKPKKPTPKW